MAETSPDTDGGTVGDLQDRIDTSVAHPARRYNYWLGGKDNFPADRASGDEIATIFPSVRTAALENRRFLGRAVDFLAREAGIRQFLDIGTGIPTADNTHEVAQAIAAESRVVYVDNDPIVLVHARALLTSSADGATTYIDADLRNPDAILENLDLRHTLDLSQPVGLMLVAILHFVMDVDRPYDLVRRLLAALPSGSYLTLTNGTQDFMAPEDLRVANAAISQGRHGDLRFRSAAEVARFFDGLELVEPGIVPVSEWRADQEPKPRPTPTEVAMYGAIGRLP